MKMLAGWYAELIAEMTVNMEVKCMVAACVIFAISVLWAFTKWNRKNLAKQLRYIGVGAILAITLLFLPFSGSKESLSARSVDPIYSLLTAIQASMLGAGYDGLMPDILQINHYQVGSFEFVYRLLMQILMLISPVLVGGIILTISDQYRDKITYFLKRRCRDISYFSELNESSVILAKSVAQDSNDLIVFCNCNQDEAPVHLVKEAKSCGFIMLADNDCDKINHCTKKTTFFEMAQNNDVNLDHTKKMIDAFDGTKKQEPDITIFLFTGQIEAEIVMNSLDNKKGILVQIIDKPVRLAYDLMFAMPLYKALEQTNTKKISALVVGADTLGKEMIKAIAWGGQLGEGYALDIHVIDVNAQQVQQKFELRYPELEKYSCNIHFHTADVTTTQFDDVLQQYCTEINYIVVSLGQHSQAVQTALYLRQYYLRHGRNEQNGPIINVFVPNLIKFSYVGNLKVGTKGYQLFPFGSDETFYSKRNIVDSEIELLARNAQAFYSGGYIDKTDAKAYKQAVLKDYNKDEINKRSNRANVIHIKAKLFVLGYEMKRKQDASVDELARAISAEKLNQIVTHTANLDCMAKMEHDRWNAFQTSEGYRSASIAQAKEYQKYTGSHKHIMAKLHPCICDWDTLDLVSEAFGQQRTYFKDYDYGFVREIANIIGVQKDDTINISGVQYIVIPLHTRSLSD